ncbi:Cullin-4 [Blyttiomyces sp. JEL0837]|nr:Cullin-4 [Blyttiomyces sp. JEL0837]
MLRSEANNNIGCSPSNSSSNSATTTRDASTITPSSSIQQQRPASASAVIDLTGTPRKMNVNASGGSRPVSAGPNGGYRNLAGTPVKKLVIKDFKVKPKIPENFESETLDRLGKAVEAIHGKRAVSESLEELYKSCENLCIQKKGEVLYGRLRALLDRHIRNELLKLQRLIMVRNIFLYLDRTYVLQTSGLKSIWDLGLELYREHIMADAGLKSGLVNGLLDLIERERNGDQVSKELIRTLLQMLVDLGIYHVTFEAPFLERSERYYKAESQQMIAEMAEGSSGTSVARFTAHVEARLVQERERCGVASGNGYLSISTRKGLVAVVERELIRQNGKLLLDKVFDEMMQHNRIEDLAALYGLLERVTMLDEMRKFFGEYIVKTGIVVVTDEARDANMVNDLLELKSRLDKTVKNSFRSNESFSNTLKESFEKFINKRQNKPAELIAKHIDALLKTGKGITETEVESVLDQCLVLFRFIHGKDVFEAFYKKDLAKRLILGKSASVDSEKSMLAKLKTECGAGFTSKLEGMFRDVETSKDIMNSFRMSARAMEQLGSLEMTVNVLTAGFWPTYPVITVNLPDELSNGQKVFRDFYMSKYSGRRLMWQSQLGSCVLKASFKKGTKELSVSLFQTVVLLQFNDAKTLTFKDLLTQTGIEEKELKRTMQSLACGKIRVINKTPKGREVDDGDSFEFNAAFENPLYRIKINQIQMKETVEENKETNERVFADRQYQVDAAIVRIMKTRKRLTHSLLIAELFDQLKFPIKACATFLQIFVLIVVDYAPDLKKRIESLIDREYLERDKDDASSYTYLA